MLSVGLHNLLLRFCFSMVYALTQGVSWEGYYATLTANTSSIPWAAKWSSRTSTPVSKPFSRGTPTRSPAWTALRLDNSWLQARSLIWDSRLTSLSGIFLTCLCTPDSPCTRSECKLWLSHPMTSTWPHWVDKMTTGERPTTLNYSL